MWLISPISLTCLLLASRAFPLPPGVIPPVRQTFTQREFDVWLPQSANQHALWVFCWFVSFDKTATARDALSRSGILQCVFRFMQCSAFSAAISREVTSIDDCPVGMTRLVNGFRESTLVRQDSSTPPQVHFH